MGVALESFPGMDFTAIRKGVFHENTDGPLARRVSRSRFSFAT